MEEKFSVRKQNHNGIEFSMYEGSEKSRAEVATKNGKYHLEGRPSITQALHQYKYGDEVIIQVYNQPGTIQKRERVNERYDRIQVFFKRDVFIEICRQFLKDLGLLKSDTFSLQEVAEGGEGNG